MSFIPVNGFIKEIFGAENPFATNYILCGSSRDQFPSFIANQDIKLSRHNLAPFGVFQCLGYRCGLMVIFGVELDSEVEFLNRFVDVMFGPSDYDSG